MVTATDYAQRRYMTAVSTLRMRRALITAPVFDNYNKYKAQPPQKPKLEWDATHSKHDAIEKFRVEVIEDGIVQGGKAEALLPWSYKD